MPALWSRPISSPPIRAGSQPPTRPDLSIDRLAEPADQRLDFASDLLRTRPLPDGLHDLQSTAPFFATERGLRALDHVEDRSQTFVREEIGVVRAQIVNCIALALGDDDIGTAVGSGESLEEGFETIELADKGVAFKVIDDPAIDTASRTGKLVMGILALIAEFENDIRRERQMDGIKKAHERGVRFGRKPLLVSEMVQQVRKLRKAGKTVPEIMRQTCLSKASVYRALGGPTQ